MGMMLESVDGDAWLVSRAIERRCRDVAKVEGRMCYGLCRTNEERRLGGADRWHSAMPAAYHDLLPSSAIVILIRQTDTVHISFSGSR